MAYDFSCLKTTYRSLCNSFLDDWFLISFFFVRIFSVYFCCLCGAVDAFISLECLCKHPERKPRYFRYIFNGGERKKIAPLRYTKKKKKKTTTTTATPENKKKEQNVWLLHRCFDSFRFLVTFILFVRRSQNLWTNEYTHTDFENKRNVT